MATRSSNPASPAASWVRNHFRSSTLASPPSQSNSGSSWPGPRAFKRLEPGHEGFGVGRDVRDHRRDMGAELLDELALEALHPGLLGDLVAPVVAGRGHGQPAVVPMGQAAMQGFGVGKFRTERAQSRKTLTTKHGALRKLLSRTSSVAGSVAGARRWGVTTCGARRSSVDFQTQALRWRSNERGRAFERALVSFFGFVT
jgi:hypothetical protein